ncbi:MAG: GTP-binding protein [Methanofollis sp.]|uniref:GTP-binding protein n=1 Tax=Methanofollis sp. TaxID=2052835 RepID=UPI0026072AD2|nr:GTP-binding protein [Methanofollis sp.]MDD4253959.1 GTP-binding protein [Methanofollis sp.]
MIPIGIPALDELLGGGMPVGAGALVSLAPGVEGQQVLYSALRSVHDLGRRCLVIVPYTTAGAYCADLSGTPYALSSEENLVFLDASVFDAIHGSRAATPLSEAAAWDDLVASLAADCGIDTVFLYCNRICDALGTEEALALFAGVCRRLGLTLYVEYLNLYDRDHLGALSANLPFDLVLSVGEGFENFLFLNHFRIEHLAWACVPDMPLPFVVRDDGYFIPYLPKIVVTGPVDAGKTTFIRTLSETSVSSDRVGVSGSPTTVAMDVGHPHVACRGFDLTLMGTPGQEHFGPIIRHLLTNATGIVFMVDGTSTASFGRARAILDEIREMGAPFVVAVNKGDLPERVPDRDLRVALSLPEETPLHSFSALDPDGAMGVLDALVCLITRSTDQA